MQKNISAISFEQDKTRVSLLICNSLDGEKLTILLEFRKTWNKKRIFTQIKFKSLRKESFFF